MAVIQKLNRLPLAEKIGFYRLLIPPIIYQRFGIDPLSFQDPRGVRVVRFFCPHGDRTCLVEIKLPELDDPIFSIQLSDSSDSTQMDWDFLQVNDPLSPKFNIHVNEHGKDTLFGWASRNIVEETKALETGYFPGQVRKGLGLTREVIPMLDFFCGIFDVKSIRLEALFYHNAVTYERHGFSYFSGYRQMIRIHQEFQPSGKLYKRLDNSTPFRKPEFARTLRGRSWAIHDGILQETDDELLEDGWVSPVMYRMIKRPRGMITFPVQPD